MLNHRSNHTSPNLKKKSSGSSRADRPATIQAPPTSIPTAIQNEQARFKAIIMHARRSSTRNAPTGEMEQPSTDILTMLRKFAEKSIGDSSRRYLSLPKRSLSERMLDSGPCWRIELHGIVQGVEPLGLEIQGDVVIGRGPEADLDLDSYGGYQQAVSRRHAMLRPTNRQLYLIDLGSTNGTTYNMIPLARCATYAVQHNDVISLGLLTMTVKIIQGPPSMVPHGVGLAVLT